MRLTPVMCACILALSFIGSAHADTHEQLTQQVRDAENGVYEGSYRRRAARLSEQAVYGVCSLTDEPFV